MAAEDFRSLSNNLYALIDGDHSDVTLMLKGGEIRAHKCILAARSKFFKALCSNLQKRFDVIYLENTDITDFEPILKFIYTGVYYQERNSEAQLKTCRVAHEFGLKKLENLIYDNIGQSLSITDFFTIYNSLRVTSNAEMEETCRNFITENGPSIALSKGFLTLSTSSLLSILDMDIFSAKEIDIIHAVEKWIKKNKPKSQTIKEIVNLIRFSCLLPQELSYVKSMPGILSESSYLHNLQNIFFDHQSSFTHRGVLLRETNVAVASMGAVLLEGTVNGFNFLHPYKSNSSYYHSLEDDESESYISHQYGSKEGVCIELHKTYLLNYITLKLRKGTTYRYCVEISVDNRRWLMVIDHRDYECTSHQFLRFHPRAVRFIRITGVRGESENFCLESLKAYYTETKCMVHKGILVPTENVARPSVGATAFGESGTMDLLLDGHHNHFEYHTTGSGHIEIRFGQPYWLSSAKLILPNNLQFGGLGYHLDCSDDGINWDVIWENSADTCYSDQIIDFDYRVITHFRIVGVSAPNKLFQCCHFECPAPTRKVLHPETKSRYRSDENSRKHNEEKDTSIQTEHCKLRKSPNVDRISVHANPNLKSRSECLGNTKVEHKPCSSTTSSKSSVDNCDENNPLTGFLGMSSSELIEKIHEHNANVYSYLKGNGSNYESETNCGDSMKNPFIVLINVNQEKTTENTYDVPKPFARETGNLSPSTSNPSNTNSLEVHSAVGRNLYEEPIENLCNNPSYSTIKEKISKQNDVSTCSTVLSNKMAKLELQLDDDDGIGQSSSNCNDEMERNLLQNKVKKSIEVAETSQHQAVERTSEAEHDCSNHSSKITNF